MMAYVLFVFFPLELRAIVLAIASFIYPAAFENYFFNVPGFWVNFALALATALDRLIAGFMGLFLYKQESFSIVPLGAVS